MDGYITIGTNLDTKKFDKEIVDLEYKLNDIESSLEMSSKDKTLFSTREIKEMEVEAEKLRNRLIDLQKKQSKIGKNDFSNMKDSLDDVGNSIQKVTKRVIRWGLAIFGIRSAYMLVRQSMSTLSQYDEQMATDIEYIRYAIANTLKPIIETILNLVKQLLIYVGYLANAWFNVDIYANASARDFAKANKNAQKLSKTLSGFDEMNILNENGTTGVANAPSFNLASLEDTPAPGWLQWLGKNGDKIVAIITGIATALTLIRFGVTAIKALGIGIAISGIVYAIENLIKFLKNPTFKNFIGILEGIAIAIMGVAIAINAWPVAIGAAIAFVIVEIVKHFDEIKEMLNNLIKWMDKNVLGGLRQLFGPVGDLIYLPIKVALDMIKTLFNDLFEGIKKIIDGIVKMFRGDFFGGIKDIFSGLFDILIAPFDSMFEAIKNIFAGVVNFIIDMINVLIDALNKISFTIPDWIPGIGGKKFGINLKKLSRIGEKQKSGGGGFRAKGGIFYPNKLPKLAVGGIINNPGAGVPYHGATIGERGAEAVVPLTDSQQMQLLGEAIGKYITINANITNTMNGRVISRELQRVQNNSDFAYNR